jgi:hypothetical protein
MLIANMLSCQGTLCFVLFCFVFCGREREKIQKILGMQTAAQNKQLLPSQASNVAKNLIKLEVKTFKSMRWKCYQAISANESVISK